MTREGVDYAFARPSLPGLFGAGKAFIARYGGPGSLGKQLTRTEAQAAKTAGLYVVALAEGAAADPLNGRITGRNHATSANAHFAGVGMPAFRPIYFAVDSNVTVDQWPRVVDYFRGVVDVLPLSRIGIYGGYNQIRWAQRDRLASWWFQTYAWSFGRWAGGNHLEQYRNGVTLVGGLVDLVRALVSDYGQWVPGGSAPNNTGGQSMTSPADLWGYEFSSAGLGVPNQAASEWLKSAFEAAAVGRQILARLDAVALDPLPVAIAADLAGLRDTVEDLSKQVQGMIEAPAVDPVAVANAIAQRPEIARTLAESVAAQLATITGEVTLSGALSGRIAPPVE